jgi:hypothetical protein
MPINRFPWVLAAGVLLAGIVGCGPRTGRVTGKVTFNGQALPSGTVSFLSADMVRTASGDIAEDGSYTVPNAPVGPVKVMVMTFRPATPGKMPEMHMGEHSGKPGDKPPRYVAIPDRYGDPEKSGLQTTIQPGEQQYDIPLAP